MLPLALPLGITLHGCMCPGFGCLRGHSANEEEDDDGVHHYAAATDGGRQLAKSANGKPNDKHHIELEIVSTDTSENGINLNKIDHENSQKKLANIKKSKNDHNHSHRHGHHSHNHDHESINVRAAIIHVLGRLFLLAAFSSPPCLCSLPLLLLSSTLWTSHFDRPLWTFERSQWTSFLICLPLTAAWLPRWWRPLQRTILRALTLARTRRLFHQKMYQRERERVCRAFLLALMVMSLC